MRLAGARWFCAGVTVALAAAPLGCGGSTAGYSYRTQPAPELSSSSASSPSRASHLPINDADSRPTIMVIDQFANPPRAAVNWRDIGEGMSEALARSLHNRGEYEVRMGDRDWKRANDLAAVRNAHPDALLFVTGSVTDFHHTGELPEAMARKGMFGRRNEAIVAVQLTIIDIPTGKVLVSEQVAGIAAAGKTPARQLYKDLSFGSYLFWSTPLGQASDQALRGVMECIGRAAIDASSEQAPDAEPDDVLEPRIIAMTGFRRVSIEGGRDRGLNVADELYLVRDKNGGTASAPVLDPITGMPVRARIDRVESRTASAWLMGEPASASEVIGAILRTEIPSAMAATESQAVATDRSAGDE